MLIGLWFMVFKATFNNMSVISWRSGFIDGEDRSTQRSMSRCGIFSFQII